MNDFDREIEISKNIFQNILTNWKKDSRVVIYFPEIKKKVPQNYWLGVGALNWTGMAEGVTGLLTEYGLDIASIHGTIQKIGRTPIGLLSLAINIKSKKDLEKLEDKLPEIKEKITKISRRTTKKSELLAHETRKIERFDDVMEIFEKKYKRVPSGLITEAVKFFIARTEAYLTERKPEDLAKIISMNYRLINRVNRSGGEPQVDAHHLETVKEKLTGVTVAGFDKDITLADVLEGIADAIPDYVIKYNKEFTTPDGILVCRIELDGFLPLKKLKTSIKRRLKIREIERIRYCELFGGIEHLARAILPVLIRDYDQSKITQVSINPCAISPKEITLKILIVGKDYDPKLCVASLSRIKGFVVRGYETPQTLKRTVCFIDLVVNAKQFPNPERIHTEIKKALKNVIGEFRDFDEGMRTEDTKRFENLKQNLPTIPRDLLKKIYYGLEDFYRLTFDEEEIREIVRIGLSLLPKEKGMEIVRLNGATLVGIAQNEDIFNLLIHKLKNYENIVNHIIFGRKHIYLVRISKNNQSVPEEEIKSFLTFLENA